MASSIQVVKRSKISGPNMEKIFSISPQVYVIISPITVVFLKNFIKE